MVAAFVLFYVAFAQAPVREAPWTLTSAISHRQPAVVDMLLKMGVNPNLSDRNGDFALDLAAQKGDLPIVQMLLSHGANWAQRNKLGAFPLHTAALAGYADVVRALLNKGAEINCKVAVSGETPIYYAASFGRTEIVRLLLERGADATVANSQGASPLSAAVAADQNEVADLLRSWPNLHGKLPPEKPK